MACLLSHAHLLIGNGIDPWLFEEVSPIIQMVYSGYVSVEGTRYRMA